MAIRIIPTMGNMDSTDCHDILINNLGLSQSNIVRCCISKASFEDHYRSIKYVQTQYKQHYGSKLQLMMDVAIPKDKARVSIDKGTEVYKDNQIVISNKDISCNCQVNGDFKKIVCGDEIYIGDFDVCLKVVDKQNAKLICKAISSGIIKNGAGIATKNGFIVPSRPDIEEKCLKLIEIFRPEYIVLSYIETVDDIIAFRDLLSSVVDYKYNLMSKIECYSAFINMAEIIANSDSIMLARGCLALNVGLENLLYVQDQVVLACIEQKVPFCIASNILKSISKRNAPLRAEVCDVAHMLSKGVENIVITESYSRSTNYQYAVDFIRRAAKVYGKEV